MLRIMRDHASSWLIKVMLFAIVVVFVFWGVGSFRSKKGTRVAEVNGELISIDDYKQSYNQLVEQYRQQFGSNLNEAMIEMMQLKSQAIDRLINQRLMLQEAARLKIRVSDSELEAAIKEIPVFLNNGVFDKKRYETILGQVQSSPEKFEKSQREGMMLEKLRDMVIDSVKVSDDEIREWFEWDGATVNLEYLFFDPAAYKDIPLEEKELTAYFDKNKDKYKTQPKVKAVYLKFDSKQFKDQTQIGEDEIREYYDANPDEFEKEKTVEARHILFKVDEGADASVETEKKDLALKVMEKAKAGEDFSALAKTYSEGPTKDRGGLLGAFKKDAMVKPFSDKAFSMKAGEVSTPVRTRFGWHIIKVEKINEAGKTSYEDAAAGIRNKLTESKSKNLAYDSALDLYDNTFDEEGLKKAAEEKGYKVIATDLFTRQGPEGIQDRIKFATAAFQLPVGQVSEVQDFADGYYLLQVTEKVEPQVPELASVTGKVESDLKKEKQWQKADADAAKCLEKIGEGLSLADAGKAYAISVAETGDFKRSDSIPKIGYETGVANAAFLLTKKAPVPEKALKGGKGYYVIRLKDRKKPPEEDLDKSREEIRGNLQRQKEQKAFESWMSALKAQSEIIRDDSMLK